MPIAREREDRVVARAEPTAAAVDGGAVGEGVRPYPPADPIARF